MNDKSPHNSRIFSATLLVRIQQMALWIWLVGIFSLNIFALAQWRLSYSDKLFDVFKRPLSWDTHLHLAQSLWQNTFKEEASQELEVAQDLFPPHNDSVLGASTTPLNLLSQWREEPQKAEQKKHFWQNIIQTYPDYRDGYIQLAALSFEEGNVAQAQKYILQAQVLDPNGGTAINMLKFISDTRGK